MVSIGVGVILLDIQGVGYRLILKNEKTPFSVEFLLILFVGKFLFTILSNGPGLPGGLFLPTLTLGALLGSLYGEILSFFLEGGENIHQYFMILGMAGFFTVVMRTPLTAIVLLLEMTGSFEYLGSFMLVALTSYVIIEILEVPQLTSTIYEKLEKDNNVQRKELSKKTTVFSCPVFDGSKLEGKKIKDIKLPKDALLIKIKREGKEVIPKGDTEILSGDILFFLTTEERENQLKPLIYELGCKI
jgi:hypothetical protein